MNRPPLPDPLPLPVVDDHTHLDIPGSTRDGEPVDDLDVGALLARAAGVGVPRAVQIGCDLPGARWTLEATDQHAGLVGGVALHPNEAPRLAGARRARRRVRRDRRLAAHPRIRVVGETGLDYFRTGEEAGPCSRSRSAAHIDWRSGSATLLIHDRDAHDDVLRILAEEGAPERTVFHCFSGDAELARECVERGTYLSFAGTVTFKNAQALRDALR